MNLCLHSFVLYGTVFLQMIPAGEDYLDSPNSTYTLFAPTNSALEKFMKAAEYDFWKDEDNILILLR